MTEIDNDDCFESEMGVPTLTIREGNQEHMIPWVTFLGGKFSLHEGEGLEKIELRFQGVEVHLEGRRLRTLWEKSQLQDLRWVREITDPTGENENQEGIVTSIQLVTSEEEGAEPPSGIH